LIGYETVSGEQTTSDNRVQKCVLYFNMMIYNLTPNCQLFRGIYCPLLLLPWRWRMEVLLNP